VNLPEAVAGIDIAASPQRVWDVVTDISLMPQWSTELQWVRWADGFDGPALGARFLGRNRNPLVGEWTTTSQIVAYDPPRIFGWAVGDPENVAATWTFDLQPMGRGTRVRYAARIGPGPSGVTMLIEREPHRAAEIVGRRLGQFQKSMSSTLHGIRMRAEHR
jgi:uncharacterized protein YndB with AHSA1/START domain